MSISVRNLRKLWGRPLPGLRSKGSADEQDHPRSSRRSAVAFRPGRGRAGRRGRICRRGVPGRRRGRYGVPVDLRGRECGRLRPERLRLQRHDESGSHPGRPRQHRQPAGAQPIRNPALRHPLPARHLRFSHGPARLQRRLLHERRGPRTESRRRRHQRRDRLSQPVLRRQLHRARQLLALSIEPHDQRDRRDRLLRERGVLGGVAGLAATASPRQRQRDPV